MKAVTTLGQFILEKQADFPYAKGELSRLLRDIGIAAKIVNREVNNPGHEDCGFQGGRPWARLLGILLCGKGLSR